ncbi:MAG: ATPase domain-containing protein, partial [Candidatus Thermoplasmatota archaeon]
MRVTSGVPGFDALIQGGFTSGAAVVVQGPSGAEKDAFLFQFVAEGLRGKGTVLIVLSSLSPAKFLQDLRAAGVDVDAAVTENRIRIVDWFSYKEEAVQDVEAEGAVFRSSIDLANVGIAISRAIAALPRDGEKRAALEILSPALNVYDLQNVYGFAQSTKAKLERFGFTSLFVIEKEMHDDRTLSSLHQPFDGVVDIERVREGDELVRKLAVLSMKGTAAESKYVPVEMGADRVLRVQAVSERERTLRHQEEMIKSNPKDPKLWLATARNLRGMGENDRALKCVDAALNLEPNDPDAWRFKAELLDALGRGGEAQAARTRAMAPVAPPPVPRKDEVAARLLGVVEQRLRGNPKDPDALFVKAAALAKTEDTKAAVETLETLAAVDDAYPGLWVLKAKLHARRGEREKAQDARRRVQEVEQRLERAARETEGRRGRPTPSPTVHYECPSCGASVGEHDTICQACGVVFEGEGEAPKETPPPRPKAELARRGLTNG